MELLELFQVITGLIGTVTGLFSVYIKFLEIRDKDNHKKPKKRRGSFWILLLVTILAFSIFGWITIASPCTDSTRYGFEEDATGWLPQTFGDSQGVIGAVQSEEQAKLCKHSLKLTVDLEGSHPNRSKGEVFVDIPVQNLVGKPISVWVYIPKDAVGPIEHPNGIQVFVKDVDDRAEYGTWWEITPALVDSWQQVTLTPSSSPPLNGSMEDEFDPTQIQIVGVKIAIGENSVDKYEGFIYIDGFDWP